MAETNSGSCYCGAVAIEVTGQPEEMGYCHCDACRSYSGSPVNAFTLWQPENVKITRGEESLVRFKSSPMSERRYCTKCGGNVMNEHPSLGLVDVYAGIIPTLAFKAAVHLNYEDTVLPMKDGLPKLRDFPAAIGGSGELMSE
ncbi:MAG: GFA family protein [Verrucomicrobiota bacterium]|nr:GFA family protein [Verrucomicrobiota bacterium]